MIQSVSFISAAFKAFAEAYLCFLASASGKKNAEAIEASKNKIYFCLKKKSNFSINKKIIFVFHTIFKLDFITQIIYCIIYRCLYSLFIRFFLLYQFLRNRT